MRLKSVEGRVEAIEEKAMTTEVVAKVAKEEATRIVEQYKNFIDLKNEVNKAVCDAYH